VLRLGHAGVCDSKMNGFMLPEKYMKRVVQEFASVPKLQGKLILTFEISCGTGGTINAFKVKRFTEDEER
jgi:hypothetical protein